MTASVTFKQPLPKQNLKFG